MEELSNDEEYNDIMEDMQEECAKVGSSLMGFVLFPIHVGQLCALLYCQGRHSHSAAAVVGEVVVKAFLTTQSVFSNAFGCILHHTVSDQYCFWLLYGTVSELICVILSSSL